MLWRADSASREECAKDCSKHKTNCALVLQYIARSRRVRKCGCEDRREDFSKTYSEDESTWQLVVFAVLALWQTARTHVVTIVTTALARPWTWWTRSLPAQSAQANAQSA